MMQLDKARRFVNGATAPYREITRLCVRCTLATLHGPRQSNIAEVRVRIKEMCDLADSALRDMPW